MMRMIIIRMRTRRILMVVTSDDEDNISYDENDYN